MSTEKFTALVFGGSGMTGRFLTEHLIHDDRYDHIKLFVRKELPVYSGKVRQFVFDPENLDQIESEITGDHLFCCLGTTIKTAGSKEAFIKTDHDLVERIAKYASSNKVRSFIVISSIGAKHNSANFYLSTKGRMEESIKTFKFDVLAIVRPSMLLGIRHTRRIGEEIGKIIARIISPLMFGSLRQYKPIHASTVAKAMIILANGEKGVFTVQSNDLEKIAANK